MNPFYNPVFLSKILKSYFFDINRLKRLNYQQLQIYRDKQIRKIINYAFTVPLYKDKYKKAGIQPSQINGVKDLHKLPLISKFDIESYYPDGIISAKANKDKLIKITTSGTTGKKLSIFSDPCDVILWFFIYIRVIREYGINWRKNKLTIIGDFAPHTIGSGYVKQGFLKNLTGDTFFKNIQWLDTNSEPKDVIKEVDKFQPDFVGGYPGMLGHLALLKEKGYGRNINPQYIATIGSVLDSSLKKFIQETFSATVFEVYGATETGTMAFQCSKGNYHIMSDIVHMEVENNGDIVSYGKAGKLIVTKLYGYGTPIIRYDAINDIVALKQGKCNCGMAGSLLEKVYGRDDLSLLFKDGKVMLASSFAEIFSRVLYELKTNKIKNTHIIQHSLKNLEIQLVIDDNDKNDKISVSDIFSIIKEGFQKKVGSDIEINIKQVEKIDRTGPRIVSAVDRNSFVVKQYI
ncbi:MAG: phenylacetate--CoA ligase family protein [Candidatus Thermoplasmatota archaeon]|nr:phenylacetate--CoA ligase family protein [Candidatus Thermoplasmatota archaeon]